MSVNLSARIGGIIGISLLVSLTRRYVVFSFELPIKAILISTYNIPYQYKRKKKNHPKLSKTNMSAEYWIFVVVVVRDSRMRLIHTAA